MICHELLSLCVIKHHCKNKILKAEIRCVASQTERNFYFIIFNLHFENKTLLSIIKVNTFLDTHEAFTKKKKTYTGLLQLRIVSITVLLLLALQLFSTL